MRDVSKSAGKYESKAGEHESMNCLPPECLLGQGASSKADIWSFGLLLYEIYVGVEDDDFPLPPDPEMTELAKEGKLIPRPLPLPLPPTCPAAAAAAVQSLCSRCFEQDPAKRASASELLNIVDAWLAEVDR